MRAAKAEVAEETAQRGGSNKGSEEAANLRSGYDLDLSVSKVT